MNLQAFTGKFHRASEPSPGVLLLELNSMWRELQVIVQLISATPSVRAVVLSSSIEKAFTAGLDLADTGGLTTSSSDPARKAFELHSHIIGFQAAISSLAQCRQPIICALFGASVGLAIDIASACDIRLCSSNTTFGIFEVNIGLAADIGTLQRFPKIVGNDSKVRELALMGRPFSAVEAEELGFVSEVVQGGREQVIARAIEKARVIASKSPVAVIGTKHILNHARDHSIEDGLQYVAAWNMSMLQSDMPTNDRISGHDKGDGSNIQEATNPFLTIQYQVQAMIREFRHSKVLKE
nr:delta(3,5)-Delta(2,4)-dienoyl-CoA isomerase [Cryptococcus depauperatus CBS 7855]